MFDSGEDVEGVLHHQGHFGIEKTQEFVARKYYWETCSCYLYLRIGRSPVTIRSSSLLAYKDGTLRADADNN